MDILDSLQESIAMQRADPLSGGYNCKRGSNYGSIMLSLHWERAWSTYILFYSASTSMGFAVYHKTLNIGVPDDIHVVVVG